MKVTLNSIHEALSFTDSRAGGNTDNFQNMMPAGVLLLVYVKENNVCVLLNKRTDRVEHHKGEISFPGGAKDPEDATILDTALRETHEEMGIIREDVEILCKLDQVPTRSGFVITPFVGIIPPSYPFRVSHIEVGKVLEVPLHVLFASDNSVDQSSGEITYSYGEHRIWGATAKILNQFRGLIAQR